MLALDPENISRREKRIISFLFWGVLGTTPTTDPEVQTWRKMDVKFVKNSSKLYLSNIIWQDKNQVYLLVLALLIVNS